MTYKMGCGNQEQDNTVLEVKKFVNEHRDFINRKIKHGNEIQRAKALLFLKIAEGGLL
jgi:hypothetical protein